MNLMVIMHIPSKEMIRDTQLCRKDLMEVVHLFQQLDFKELGTLFKD